MISTIIFQNMLMLSTLLTSLVTGFILIFAIVVMPGLAELPSADFLRAFQVIDRVIQNNQPLFVFIWVGSAISLLIATTLGMMHLDGITRILLITAALSFIVGTQLPTSIINIPLNNHVQNLVIDEMSESEQLTERHKFESRWNRWNILRTVFAAASSVLLIIVLRML